MFPRSSVLYPLYKGTSCGFAHWCKARRGGADPNSQTRTCQNSVRDEEINSERTACPKNLMVPALEGNSQGGSSRRAETNNLSLVPQSEECGLGLCHQGIASSSFLRKKRGGKRKMIQTYEAFRSELAAVHLMYSRRKLYNICQYYKMTKTVVKICGKENARTLTQALQSLSIFFQRYV